MSSYSKEWSALTIHNSMIPGKGRAQESRCNAPGVVKRSRSTGQVKFDADSSPKAISTDSRFVSSSKSEAHCFVIVLCRLRPRIKMSID